MESANWHRVDDVIANALEMPESERAAYLERELAGDSEALALARRLVGLAEPAEKLFAQTPLAAWGKLETGMRVGPWMLEKFLGSGGMGVVWKAQRVDGAAEMAAAIKFLPTYLTAQLGVPGGSTSDSGADLLRQFQREKQILARLEHPNIARLLDAQADKGIAQHFVMEFVEGVPLAEFARGKSFAELEPVMQKICDAVQYAHGQLVIHRDLKPGNVLMRADGEPKLLDFGIAKTWDDAGASVTLYRAMSLDYASREQIDGRGVGTAADQFALGMIFYELVTGEKARDWSGKGTGWSLEEAARFLLPEREGARGDLLAVLRKATAPLPADRYGSVGELALDLRRVREGRVIAARPASLWRVVSSVARRHWLPLSGVAVALAVIVALSIWSAIAAKEAREQRALAEARSSKLELALSAERQAKEAEERQRGIAQQMTEKAQGNEKLAESRLDESMQILASTILEVRQKISKQQGGVALGAQMLEDVLTKLKRLDKEGKPSVKQLRLQAEAHAELASVYAGPNSNLGMQEQARLHEEQAVALWKRLAAENPEDGWLQLASINADFQKARRSIPQGAPYDPAFWKKFEAAYLKLEPKLSRWEKFQMDTGTYYFYRGLAQPPADRVKDMAKALERYERIYRSLPKDERNLRNLALTHKYMAGGLVLSKQSGGLAHAEAAARYDRERVQQNPDDLEAKMDLSFSIVSQGDASTDRSAAGKLYREGYELRKSLAKLDPKNRYFTRSLWYPLSKFTTEALRQKDWDSVRYSVNEFPELANISGVPATSEMLAEFELWKRNLAGK